MEATEIAGTQRHQTALKALTAHYAGDPRVLAFSLFGSLARGNWDEYSDLDLDVILRDDVTIDARREVQGLVPVLESIGERVALMVKRGQESVDLALLPLLEISIRYHALATTSPNIVESVVVLAGTLTTEQVRAAGWANTKRDLTPPSELLDACMRYALETDSALRRGELWLAVELLHRARGLLMEVFAQAHGGARPTQTFDAHAGSALQAGLGATLPTFDLSLARHALLALLDVLEHDIPAFSSGKAQLTADQSAILRAIRAREAV